MLFRSPRLTLPTDKSFWTEVRPELLVHAACYQLEATMRNSQGLADALAIITDELRGVDKDMALSESYSINQMEG